MSEVSTLTKGFGQNVAEIRRRKGLTQQQVASKLNVSHTTISLIETGKRWSTPSVIERMAKVLGVPISDLFKNIN